MSLPAPWVEKIFEKLTLTYGHLFLGRWAGLDMTAVKDDWGRELSRLQQNPRAISYALQHLPADNPPTVLQFRELANRRPDETPPALPAPPADPELVKQALAGLSLLSNNIPARAAEWRERMYELRRTGAATRCQLDAIKQFAANLGVSAAPVVCGEFVSPPQHTLPPGMRAVQVTEGRPA